MSARHDVPFCHEALLYAGEDEFVEGTLPFIRSGVEVGEPVMVAVTAPKIARLRRELGRDADHVEFVDMPAIGMNPGTIISAWHDWVARRPSPDAGLWGIGEPVWPERTPDELEECFRHECLLNAAFESTPGFRLLCPYDTSALSGSVVERAHESHPAVVHDGSSAPSERYAGLDALRELLSEPLREPVAPVHELDFDADTLVNLRQFVLGQAIAAGIEHEHAEDIVLAVNELATNSVRHGGGAGTLRLWREGDDLACEVRDRGRISDPLVGRRRPVPGRNGGYGLWMVNQLSDLVHVRSSGRGTVVRVRMSRAPARRSAVLSAA